MKEHKKLMHFLRWGTKVLIVVLALSFVSPGSPQVQAASKVNSVTVSNLPAKTLTLKKGKSFTIKPKVNGSKGVSQKVTYKTSRKTVATVSSKGKITAKKKGKATITVTSKANTKKKFKINVTVGTPVKKVASNQKSVSIFRGKNETLTATLSPKKPSNKTIIWSSSNEKVATVNSKGKVTAVSAGTAKITATAADGSGKKATATVTVKNPVTLAGVSAINQSTIQVQLSSPQALTAGNFVVKVSMYGAGRYNKTIALERVTTADQKTYTLALDHWDPLYDLNNIQVTVNGLDGTGSQSLTTVYKEGGFQYTGTETYAATVGKAVSEALWSDGVGYRSYSVANLPTGVKWKVDGMGESVLFYGKPTIAGQIETTVTILDEGGNTYTYKVIWVIGSDKALAASYEPKRNILGTNGTCYVSSAITIRGGSGSYNYEIVGTADNFQIDSSGKVSGTIKAAGTYNIPVKVTDTNNVAYTTTATASFVIDPSVTISGTIKDASGNPVEDAYVNFMNKDKGVASKYPSIYTDSITDSDGSYSVTLPVGTYDIKVSYSLFEQSTYKCLYSQVVNSSRSDFDMSLALHKITLYSDDSSVSPFDFGYWYDADGIAYGYGDTLILLEGSYTLTSSGRLGISTYDATVSFTAGRDSVATASIKHNTVNAGAISLNQTVNATVNGDSYTYYIFTPTESKTYYFYTISGYDTYGCLYNANQYLLKQNNDDGTDKNFLIAYSLTANQKYYIGVRMYASSSTHTIPLTVSDTNPESLSGATLPYEEGIPVDAEETVMEVADAEEIVHEDSGTLEEVAENADAVEEVAEDADIVETMHEGADTQEITTEMDMSLNLVETSVDEAADVETMEKTECTE